MDHTPYDRTDLETEFNGQNGPIRISRCSESQSRLEASKFQGRRQNFAQEHSHLEEWPSKTADSTESHGTGNGLCWEQTVQQGCQRRPVLKLQSSLKFPTEEDELEETILMLRLFKGLGYSDQEVAFGYCSQSTKLTNMFINLQSNERSNLEDFFNVLRRRRPTDLDKAAKEFFGKRQGQNEDEDDVMSYLQGRYHLMHGRMPGQLTCPPLNEGEKCLLKHRFIMALKDDWIRYSMKTSSVQFEDLTSKARSIREARDAFKLAKLEDKRKKEEQDHSSFLSGEMKTVPESYNFKSSKVETNGTKKVNENFKNVSNNQLAKFKLFNPSKLKFPPRIQTVFDPKPGLVYQEGKDEGYLIFEKGICVHTVLQKMKSNPMVKRGIGKIQFWAIKDSAQSEWPAFTPSFQ